MSFQNVAVRMRRVIGLGGMRRAPDLDQMKVVLPDLRTADPGFLLELRDGRLPLTGSAIVIGAKGAFDSPVGNDSARRELYSFAWLRHLTGARSADAEDHARRLLLAWTRSAAKRHPLADEPAVAARRLMSLLAHADTALTGADAKAFDQIVDLVAADAKALADAAPRMPMALPRLTALIALTAFQVCRGSGRDADRLAMERRLVTELDRQILPDGGHISRNPAAVLELALDLIPLQRAYAAVPLTPPPALGRALTRLGGMLALLSHPDRQLGRFNGMGATALTEVAMVNKTLAAARDVVGTRHATDTGYIRLVNADTLVLFDAGPGAETLAGEAPVAGALSFEVSVARAPMIVNTGFDHGPFGQPKPEARATSSHSAFVLGNASSAPPTGARGGSTRVALVTETGDDAARTITASQDGYRQRFGYTHHRTLSVLRDGWLIEGADRLEAASKEASAVPFDIRFHLHPTVYVATDPASETLRLTLADGSRWMLSVMGATVVLEPTTFFAGQSGAKPSLQIVLKGTADTAMPVTWRFERMSPAAVS